MMFDRKEIMRDNDQVECLNLIANILYQDYIALHDDFFQLFQESFHEIDSKNLELIRKARVEFEQFWDKQNEVQHQINQLPFK